MNTDPSGWPRSIAIAGAWGYIGRKFLDVALERGLEVAVHDPGPAPSDVDLSRVLRFQEEAAFHAHSADLFHLALHPEHRRLDLLLGRPDTPVILNEKPMALPERPGDCARIIEAVDATGAVVLHDFPELFDPITGRILDFLRAHQDTAIHSIQVERSKDREDPSNPRNFKRMVTIQYQESVHCLAFVLRMLGEIAGSVEAVLDQGLRLESIATPYAPPNPEAYPFAVDGRCSFHAHFGVVDVTGETNFLRGAPWRKLRRMRGTADGRPFNIEASYLEGDKWLRIDGQDQALDPLGNSYAHVLDTLGAWTRAHDRATLMNGLFPNPRFGRWTYQLSSALWRASRSSGPLAFRSANDLAGWDARFTPGA